VKQSLKRLPPAPHLSPSLLSPQVSFFELWAQAQCAASIAAEGAVAVEGEVGDMRLRMIRAIKPLRWFKIARIMKLGKAGPIIVLLMDSYNITPTQGLSAKVGFTLVISIHLLASLWWLSKVAFLTPDDINAWLDDQTWKTGYEREELATVAGKLEAYVISVYAVTMTITTVGYGDISAEGSWERCMYTILFIVGAFVWGNLLAEIGEIHQVYSSEQQGKRERIQKTLEVLLEHSCPRALRLRIIQWTRFQDDIEQQRSSRDAVIAQLPLSLRHHFVDGSFLQPPQCTSFLFPAPLASQPKRQ